MRITREQIEYCKRATVVAAVLKISEERKMSKEKALHFFVKTDTFDRLQHEDSRLYLQSI